MSAMFYNGCWGNVGHYLFSEDGSSKLAAIGPFKRGELDCCLCPGYAPLGASYAVRKASERPRAQVEGEAKLTHRDGWTALAFWDRSVDKRGNSNSCFVIEGTHTFEEMIELARARFPRVMERFKFEIRIVGA